MAPQSKVWLPVFNFGQVSVIQEGYSSLYSNIFLQKSDESIQQIDENPKPTNVQEKLIGKKKTKCRNKLKLTRFSTKSQGNLISHKKHNGPIHNNE